MGKATKAVGINRIIGTRGLRKTMGNRYYKAAKDKIPECSDLFEALFYLDSMVEEKEILYSKLEQKYGKEVIDKAFEYYSSSTDYFNDKNAEKLPSIFYEALFDIDTLISLLPDISYSIKVARYEVREAFERLIDALYPKKQ